MFKRIYYKGYVIQQYWLDAFEVWSPINLQRSRDFLLLTESRKKATQFIDNEIRAIGPPESRSNHLKKRYEPEAGLPSSRKPRLKGNTELVAREEVSGSQGGTFHGLVNTIKVWKSPKGFYIYYHREDGRLELASGPHKSKSRTLKEAKRLAEVLKK